MAPGELEDDSLPPTNCETIYRVFKRKPVTATVGDHSVRCLVCGGEDFWNREIQLNTSGLEFLGMEWANASATGLICVECGYVHEFAGSALQLHKTS